MPRLGHLWLATITHSDRFSGTDSEIVLIVSGGRTRNDMVHFTLPDTSQSDFERNQANIYEVDEKQIVDSFQPARLDTDDLTTESVRIATRGSDAWKPEAALVWGRETRDEGQIVPLAFASQLQPFISFAGQLAGVELSTDADEGETSFRVPSVQPGGPTMVIRDLIVAMVTADVKDAGTDDLLHLRITTLDGRVVVDHDMKDTDQEDQERGEANMYFVPVITPFSKSELGERSIELSTRGDDAWLPASFFIFGADDENSRFPEQLEPLVHVETWGFGNLSTDSGEGSASVILPLVQSAVPAPIFL
jgi:hypothetical protein